MMTEKKLFFNFSTISSVTNLPMPSLMILEVLVLPRVVAFRTGLLGNSFLKILIISSGNERARLR